MLRFAWKGKYRTSIQHTICPRSYPLSLILACCSRELYIYIYKHFFFNLSFFFQDAAVHFNASAKYYHLFGKLILLTVSCAHQTHLALLSGMIKPFSTTAAVLHKEQLVCVRFSHLIRTAAPSFRVIKPFPPPC